MCKKINRKEFLKKSCQAAAGISIAAMLVGVPKLSKGAYYVTELDMEKCTGCLECMDVCPMELFIGDPVNELPVIENPEECLGCGSCVEVCEADAIVVEEG
jgi:NAD-dependent dihydropyrimidine dehydrogenase PreA subunit